MTNHNQTQPDLPSQASQQLGSLSTEIDYHTWLQLQTGLIESAFASLLVVGDEQGGFKPVALWPEVSVATERLAELCDQVLEESSGLITELGQVQKADVAQQMFGVAYPVKQQDQILAVIAVGVSLTDERSLPAVMKQLQWGACWIELKVMRQRFSERKDDFQRLSTSVDLLARVLPEPGFDGAAMRLITELAINLNCNLVSIGLLQEQRIQLAHLSHSADFGSHMNLVRAIEDVMDEAVDQCLPIVYPTHKNAPQNVVTVAHKALADMQQSETILTLPLQIGERWLGAVTLQRDIEQPFTQADVSYCESVLVLAASALQEKRFNDRPLWRKILDAGKQQFERLFGPGFVGRKLALGIAAVVVILLMVVTGDYRLSADASVQAVSQRVISAPFDGYIKTARARAGDEVQEDDQLLQLDDRDLLLERLKWRGQQSKLARQYQEAIAAHDRARITILDAQLEQAKAQLDLVEGQLTRARITAPFNGLIVSGDLSQRLGDAVSQGEVLYEISPVNTYRVDLNVKESRIADVVLGQFGTLYLSALPEQPFSFVVSKITPVTEQKDGATYFVVEAILTADPELLRPGMEGVGKISVGERNLFASWTRELRDWLRLQLWRWWG